MGSTPAVRLRSVRPPSGAGVVAAGRRPAAEAVPACALDSGERYFSVAMERGA